MMYLAWKAMIAKRDFHEAVVLLNKTVVYLEWLSIPRWTGWKEKEKMEQLREELEVIKELIDDFIFNYKA